MPDINQKKDFAMTKILAVCLIILLLGSGVAHAESIAVKRGGGGTMMEYDESGRYLQKLDRKQKSWIASGKWVARGALKFVPFVGTASILYDGYSIGRRVMNAN